MIASRILPYNQKRILGGPEEDVDAVPGDEGVDDKGRTTFKYFDSDGKLTDVYTLNGGGEVVQYKQYESDGTAQFEFDETTDAFSTDSISNGHARTVVGSNSNSQITWTYVQPAGGSGVFTRMDGKTIDFTVDESAIFNEAHGLPVIDDGATSTESANASSRFPRRLPRGGAFASRQVACANFPIFAGSPRIARQITARTLRAIT
jgi:hypothetical protein